MTIQITKFGDYYGANSESGTGLLRLVVQNLAQTKASTLSDLTDSSGGTPASEITTVTADLVNEADSGTSLASKTTAEAKLNLVKDGLLELMTKANTIGTLVGLASTTYNGGGTSVDGTIAAVGLTTAATTGALATNTNAIITALNNAMYNVAVKVAQVCDATGVTRPVITATGTYGTVGAIAIDVGTAADPGVSKTALDAKLVSFTNMIGYLAARLNAVTGTNTAMTVVAV